MTRQVRCHVGAQQYQGLTRETKIFEVPINLKEIKNKMY
jgi:hypothetical protein